MKTQIQEQEESIIVRLEGTLDFVTAEDFKEDLMQIKNTAKNRQVIFDFSGLNFVGSSGIASLINSLREFNAQTTHPPRYTNVKNEFKRVITSLDRNQTFDFWENVPKSIIDS